MGVTEWEAVTLGDVLERVKRPIDLQGGETYQTLGIRSRAGGLFLKPPIRGSEIAAKKLFRVETDDVVYSRLFSWQGSFGVARAGVAGCVASGEFPTFRAHDRLLPAFFNVWASRLAVWEEAELMCTGTTAGSRNRLKEEDFLSLEIDLPPIDDQHRIVNATSALDRALAHASADLVAATNLRRALLSHVSAQMSECATELRPLGELADVASGMAWARSDECDADRGIAALRVANVQLVGVDLSELRYILSSTKGAATKTIRPDSLIMVRTNTAERVGNAQFVPPEAVGFAYSSFLIQVAPHSREDLGLIARFLQAPEVQAEMTDRARGTSASLTNIPVTWLRELEVPVVHGDQREKLLGRVGAIETVAKRLRDEVARIHELRSATVAALLSRERRVRDGAPRAEKLVVV